MNERQKKLLKKLGLSEEDFEQKDKVVSADERINDLEVALCELLDLLTNE